MSDESFELFGEGELFHGYVVQKLLGGLDASRTPASVDPLSNPNEDVRVFLSTRQRREQRICRCRRLAIGVLALLLSALVAWVVLR